MLKFGAMVELAYFNDSGCLFGWSEGKSKFPLFGIARLKWF
jgi:hypothetical protein